MTEYFVSLIIFKLQNIPESDLNLYMTICAFESLFNMIKYFPLLMNGNQIFTSLSLYLRRVSILLRICQITEFILPFCYCFGWFIIQQMNAMEWISWDVRINNMNNTKNKINNLNNSWTDKWRHLIGFFFEKAKGSSYIRIRSLLLFLFSVMVI